MRERETAEIMLQPLPPSSRALSVSLCRLVHALLCFYFVSNGRARERRAQWRRLTDWKPMDRADCASQKASDPAPTSSFGSTGGRRRQWRGGGGTTKGDNRRSNAGVDSCFGGGCHVLVRNRPLRVVCLSACIVWASSLVHT